MSESRRWRRLAFILTLLLLTTMALAACGSSRDDAEETATADAGVGDSEPTATTAAEPTATAADTTPPPSGGAGNGEFDVEVSGDLRGEINIDGSSTVFPISQALAEEFNALAPDVRITVGTSGTGGGFEKFCAGDTQISNASRPIKDDEMQACADNGVEFTEVEIAFDGLTVAVNSENDWVDCMTVDQLNQIWKPDSTVKTWSDIDPSWPDETIDLYGPGTDSGTFDYFTDEINGEEGASRADYTASEDDNVLVQGVAGGQYALGYFGFAYYVENRDSLKALAIDGGSGCVAPDHETIASGEYTPLSRPLFIYVNNAALADEAVHDFVLFQLTDEAQAIVPEVGFVELDAETLATERQELLAAIGE